jgi:hypothetical protein
MIQMAPYFSNCEIGFAGVASGGTFKGVTHNMTTSSDSNAPSAYEQIYQPRTPQLPPYEAQSELEAVLYRVAQTLLNYSYMVEALLYSLNRYLDAVDATAVTWEIRQANAVITYSQQVAEYLANLEQVLPEYRRALDTFEVQGKRIWDLDPPAIADMQQAVTTMEVSPALLQQLAASGYDISKLDDMKTQWRATSPEAFLENLSGAWVSPESTQEAMQRYRDLANAFRLEKRLAIARTLPEPLISRDTRCSHCGQPVTWISQYERWYCTTCQTYR